MKAKQITLRLPDNLKAQVEQVAERKGISFNAEMINLLMNFVRQDEFHRVLSQSLQRDA